MESTSQYLFLASAVKDGEGFWVIGARNNDENILADKTILDCHRKELIGNESAKEILYAINLNLDNLVNGLEKSNFLIDRPLKGISFNIPLNIMENIFDFWIDIYKNKEAWETCLGLLKIRKRLPLSHLIKSGSLKGNSKKWALEIETLHKYEPNSQKNNNKNEPMWK